MEQEIKWATDADKIDPGGIDRILFRNGIVEEFIKTGNKYFLVAGKGIGKTLLLKYKRHMLETAVNEGCIFVPIDRPYLDQVTWLGDLSDLHLAYLRNWHNARDLWELAISLSGISYYYVTTHANPPALWSKTEKYSSELERLTITTRLWRPSEVFIGLLLLPISALRKFVNKEHIQVNRGLASVHSEMCFFIDQLDQALLHYNDWPLWQAVQIGLLEAAWED